VSHFHRYRCGNFLNDSMHAHNTQNYRRCFWCIQRFDQSRKKFVQALLDNMDSQFPGDEMMTAATVLNPTMWPTDIDEKVLYGDCEVAKLAKDAGIPVRNKFFLSICATQFRIFDYLSLPQSSINVTPSLIFSLSPNFKFV